MAIFGIRDGIATRLGKNRSGGFWLDSYNSFHPESYLTCKYGFIPSEFSSASISYSILEWLKKMAVILRDDSSIKDDGTTYINTMYFFFKKEKAIAKCRITWEGSPVYLSFYYQKNTDVSNIIETIKTYHVPQVNSKENKISIIVQTQGGLTTKSYDIKIDNIDISSHYGDFFVPVYNKVVDSLNKEDSKGLVLFHGVPGSGKTSVIKHIAKNLTKQVIFIPPYLGESLCSPGFIPFLMERRNSVLIIEDAERIIADRNNSRGSEGVSNILNITDGILGDCLNIQIIATFNTSRDKIDQALLRKGRLIAEHEFNKLSVAESNRLLSHLGKDHVTQSEMTLADIYNIEETSFRKEEKRSPIGFKAA